jgi:hypothetical protein
VSRSPSYLAHVSRYVAAYFLISLGSRLAFGTKVSGAVMILLGVALILTGRPSGSVRPE